MSNTKDKILLTIDYLVFDFLYYDRKNDKYLQLNKIQNSIINKEITLDDMSNRFKQSLSNFIGN